MASVFLTGMAVVDFVFSVEEMPTQAEKYRAENAEIVGGGCAANAAVAVARLGGSAALAARLGADQLGDLIIADLEKENVQTAFVRRFDGGRSAFSSIYVDHNGERQIMNFRGDNLGDSADWMNAAPKCDAYLADSRWTAGAAKTMQLARRYGVPGIVDAEDPVDPEVLNLASHVAFSRQGIVGLTGEKDLAKALMRAKARIPGWVCVTDGAAGVFYIGAHGVEHIPAFPVSVKDTLGAGDIWHGAFALRLAEGADERGAITFACAAAALKCMEQGGRAGCPDRTKTEQFLEENRQCS